LRGIKKSDSLVEQHTHRHTLPNTEINTHTEMSRIYDDYEAKTLEAKAQLGERAVVIFEVGSFCQIMSIEDGLVDIHRLADILKAIVVRLDKKNPVVSRDNYLMIGWPTAYHDTMVERLRAHDYHACSAAHHEIDTKMM